MGAPTLRCMREVVTQELFGCCHGVFCLHPAVSMVLAAWCAAYGCCKQSMQSLKCSLLRGSGTESV